MDERLGSKRFAEVDMRRKGGQFALVRGSFPQAEIFRAYAHGPRRVKKPGREKIHGRRADKTRHKRVGRAFVYFKRRGDLLEPALVHHDNPLPHRHRLGLVVGDVNHGRPQTPVQTDYFRAHFHAHFGVQIG